jgi:imidazolonepropionase-like amidohydrolase
MDGQITNVVLTRDLEKIEADRTFDCQGLYVIPGLINAHSHVLLPGAALIGLDLIVSLKRQMLRNLEECPLRGVTTVRDASTLSYLLNDMCREIETLELLGPRVLSCGPSITVKCGYPDYSRPLPSGLAKKYGSLAIYVTGPDSARQAVRTAVEDEGARFVKIFFDDRALSFVRKPLKTRDDESVKAIVDEAHRLGRRVAAHVTQIAGFRRAINLGVDDFEHIPIDGLLTDRDIANFMKGDHHITPTATVGMALGFAPPGHPARSNPAVEAMQALRDRLLGEILPALSEEAVLNANRKMAKIYMEGDPSKQLVSALAIDNELFLETIQGIIPNILKLREAGATFCCGNDGGTPLSFPAALSMEMEIMEWLGFSRADVVRSATINGAKLLELEDELGSIESGKLADMVILSADPLKDIRAVERIEAVFRSGALLTRGRHFPLESSQQ